MSEYVHFATGQVFDVACWEDSVKIPGFSLLLLPVHTVLDSLYSNPRE